MRCCNLSPYKCQNTPLLSLLKWANIACVIEIPFDGAAGGRTMPESSFQMTASHVFGMKTSAV